MNLLLNDITNLICETILDKKLYHGSSIKKRIIKPDSIHYGNKLRKPHWASYFWKNKNRARVWSIYRKIFYTYKKENKKTNTFMYHRSNKIWITQDEFNKVIKSFNNKETYIYTVKERIYNIGIGHEKFIDEYTIDKEIKPIKEDTVIITDKLINEVCEVVDIKKIEKEKERFKSGNVEGDRGLFKIFMLDHNEKVERMQKANKNRDDIKVNKTQLDNFFK